MGVIARANSEQKVYSNEPKRWTKRLVGNYQRCKLKLGGLWGSAVD